MTKTKGIRIRMSDEEKLLMEKKAKKFGFAGLSEYLRFVGKNCKQITISLNKESV